jgi:hypothetical protein
LGRKVRIPPWCRRTARVARATRGPTLHLALAAATPRLHLHDSAVTCHRCIRCRYRHRAIIVAIVIIIKLRLIIRLAIIETVGLVTVIVTCIVISMLAIAIIVERSPAVVAIYRGDVIKTIGTMELPPARPASSPACHVHDTFALHTLHTSDPHQLESANMAHGLIISMPVNKPLKFRLHAHRCSSKQSIGTKTRTHTRTLFEQYMQRVHIYCMQNCGVVEPNTFACLHIINIENMHTMHLNPRSQSSYPSIGNHAIQKRLTNLIYPADVIYNKIGLGAQQHEHNNG